VAQETPQIIRSAPSERRVIYPESDGKPMAETDIHRQIMIDFIEMLSNHFRSRLNVYVSGNLFLYYDEGNPKVSVAPDVFVVFGVEKRMRRTYKLWEEGKGPDFVLELVSGSTYREDLGRKKRLYASVLKVQEYFLYEPDYRYLPSPLMGYRLVNGIYLPIRPVEGRLSSSVLSLELGEKDIKRDEEVIAPKLGLYNPQTGSWLLKPAEETEARRQAEAGAQQESLARRQAEARAQQAEAELARLRALLEQ